MSVHLAHGAWSSRGGPPEPPSRPSCGARAAWAGRSRACAALAVLVVALAPAARAGDYYVDNANSACSDSSAGTQASPYCTISAALVAHHDPGTTIHVLPGVYRETVSLPDSGLASSPITIQAESTTANPVVIDCADDYSAPSLWSAVVGDVWLAASVTWSPRQVFADSTRLSAATVAPDSLPPGSFLYVPGTGLYVNVGGGSPAARRAAVGRRSYGIQSNGESWVTIDGFTVLRAETYGILFDGPLTGAVATHDTVRWSFDAGIYAENCWALHIAGNVSTDNGNHGIALLLGTTGCTIANNECARNVTTPGALVACGIMVSASPGNVVSGNLLHDNDDEGLQFQNGADGSVSLQNRAWNNNDHGFDDLKDRGVLHVGDDAYGNRRAGFVIDGGSVDDSLFDCIGVVNGLQGGYDLWVDSTSTAGFVSNDNLFWNPNGESVVRYGKTDYASVAAYSAVSGQDTRTLEADPLFVDPMNGDFRLGPGSPAIDDGNSGVPYWPATDALGHPRVDDPATPNRGLGPIAYADRGALEYVPGSGTAPSSVVPAMNHVIVVVMENHSYDEVRTAPYTASLIRRSASFSQSYGVAHPSQPNYLALWSASTQGVTSDACPPPGSPFADENLGHAVAAAGLTWKAYAEDLPAVGDTVCDAVDSPGGALYSRKHDPWMDWANVDHDNAVPFTQLAADIGANALPNLAFVIPNNCDNTHDTGCPVDTGDVWLASHLPAMISAVGPYGLVILTWDEDDGTAGNQVLTVFAGPAVKPGYVSTQLVNHYSVVRTICQALQIAPFAAAATAHDIVGVWNDSTTSVPPGPGLSLGLAWPNPFRQSMAVRLSLPAPTSVSAQVFDIAGRHVKTLASGVMSGSVVIRWDGSGDDGSTARQGIYLLRVQAGGLTAVRKLVRVE